MEINQDLEKLIIDIEKGALRVDSVVLVETKLYDAKCYRIRSANPEEPDTIRIDLREKKEWDER